MHNVFRFALHCLLFDISSMLSEPFPLQAENAIITKADAAVLNDINFLFIIDNNHLSGNRVGLCVVKTCSRRHLSDVSQGGYRRSRFRMVVMRAAGCPAVYYLRSIKTIL